jgi:hypothetical protein
MNEAIRVIKKGDTEVTKILFSNIEEGDTVFVIGQGRVVAATNAFADSKYADAGYMFLDNHDNKIHQWDIYPGTKETPKTVRDVRNAHLAAFPFSHVFDEETLRCTGETISGMRLLKSTVHVDTIHGEVECYCVSSSQKYPDGERRRVYHYFDVLSMQNISPKEADNAERKV